MNEKDLISALITDAGFSSMFIEKVKLPAASSSAKEAAYAFVNGGGVYDEIRKHKPDCLDEIKLKLEKELAVKFGAAPMIASMSAIISQAWK
jgi:hypothetical protein